MGYARELSAYLQTLEQRLFSEGLHTLGHAPDADETEQYLAAYFGDDLPPEVCRSLVCTRRPPPTMVCIPPDCRCSLCRAVACFSSGACSLVTTGPGAFFFRWVVFGTVVDVGRLGEEGR